MVILESIPLGALVMAIPQQFDNTDFWESLSGLGEVTNLNNLEIMFGIANGLDLPLGYLVECSVRKFGSEAVRNAIKAALEPHRKAYGMLTAALGGVENPRTIGATEHDALDALTETLVDDPAFVVTRSDGPPKLKDEPLAYDDRLSLAKRVFVN